jgi:hypothetical protein
MQPEVSVEQPAKCANVIPCEPELQTQAPLVFSALRPLGGVRIISLHRPDLWRALVKCGIVAREPTNDGCLQFCEEDIWERWE